MQSPCSSIVVRETDGDRKASLGAGSVACDAHPGGDNIVQSIQNN